jgi:hypothetical protein
LSYVVVCPEVVLTITVKEDIDVDAGILEEKEKNCHESSASVERIREGYDRDLQ